MHLVRRDERRKSLRLTTPKDGVQSQQSGKEVAPQDRSSPSEVESHGSMAEFAMKYFRYEGRIRVGSLCFITCHG